MAIQVIDNFEINVAKAIDNRFVVGPTQFYTTRDSISYKYAGLRIWDLNDLIPYVWTGATWSTESSNSISGSGTSNYLPRFIAANIVQNSVIYQDVSGNIGIGTITPTKKLEISGDIKATGFYGIGTNITLINATNITTGTLAIARVATGASTGSILISSTQPTWSDQVQIGTAPSAGLAGAGLYFKNPAAIALRIYGRDEYYGGESGSLVLEVASTQLEMSDVWFRLTSTVEGYITAPILYLNTKAYILDGSVSTPSISFLSDTNTGLYRPTADQIGFTTGGVNRLNISSTGITASVRLDLPAGSAADPSLTFGDVSLYNGLYRSSNSIGISTIGVSRFLVSSSNITSTLNMILPAGSVGAPSINFGNTNTGIYQSGTYEIGFSTEGSEMMKMTSYGISAFCETIDTSLSTFTISSGTATLTTGLDITATTFDRVIYVYSSRIDNAFYITTGFFDINIILTDTATTHNIYSFSCDSNSPKSFHVSYSFILPANRIARIEYTKDTLAFSSGSGIVINTKWDQLGRTIYGVS